MKVKELIEELQKINPEKEVMIFDEKNEDAPLATIIQVTNNSIPAIISIH